MPPARIFLGCALVASWLARQTLHLDYGIASVAGLATALFLVQFFAWIIWSWLIYPKAFSPLRDLPQPSGGSFFMGQFWNLKAKPNGEVYRDWTDEVNHDGIIRYLGLLNLERLLVVSPNALSEILVTKTYDFVKPPQLVSGLGRILGIGLFLAEGDEHKRQRKDLAPAFAFRHIKEMYPVFWEKSKELINAIIASQEHSRKEGENDLSIDVADWTSRATLDIIGTAGLGRDFKSLKDPNNGLIQIYKRLFKPSGSQKVLALLSSFLPTWLIRGLPVKRNSDILAASLVIQKTCLDLIQQKKQILSKSSNSQQQKDILSVALMSGGFNDTDLVNQLMTFLLAGHETTASALSWAISMLSAHPSMQETLYAELRAHNIPCPLQSTSSRTITAAEMDTLPYLTAFCNETLRLYPPVAHTVRIAAHDTTLCKHFIPANTRILIPPWAVNADPALWGPDAREFNPSRWLNKDGKLNGGGGAESNYSFLTFSHGPRSCIGAGFARREFACLLAAWVGAFETRFAEEGFVLRSRMGLTARPRDLKVRVKLRERW